MGLSGFETLKEITQEQDWHIYETADPLPHAFIASAAQVIADNDMALRKLASGEIDPAQSVVVEHAVTCVPSTPGDAVSEGEAQIVRYTPNVVEIETHSEQPGVLVLTDTYDPYWKITIDGQPADLLRVDTALRGVCVAAGVHQVRFEYRPVLLFVGLLISAMSWVLVAIVGLITLKNRL